MAEDANSGNGTGGKVIKALSDILPLAGAGALAAAAPPIGLPLLAIMGGLKVGQIHQRARDQAMKERMQMVQNLMGGILGGQTDQAGAMPSGQLPNTGSTLGDLAQILPGVFAGNPQEAAQLGVGGAQPQPAPTSFVPPHPMPAPPRIGPPEGYAPTDIAQAQPPAGVNLNGAVVEQRISGSGPGREPEVIGPLTVHPGAGPGLTRGPAPAPAPAAAIEDQASDQPVQIDRPGSAPVTMAPAPAPGVRMPTLSRMHVSGVTVNPMTGNVSMTIAPTTAQDKEDAALGAFADGFRQGVPFNRTLMSLMAQGIFPSKETVDHAVGPPFSILRTEFQTMLVEHGETPANARVLSAQLAARLIGAFPSSAQDVVEAPFNKMTPPVQEMLGSLGLDWRTATPDQIAQAMAARADFDAQAAGKRAYAEGEATTDVLVGREEKMRPGTVETARQTKEAQVGEEPVPASEVEGAGLDVGTRQKEVHGKGIISMPQAEINALNETRNALTIIGELEKSGKDIFTAKGGYLSRAKQKGAIELSRAVGGPLGILAETYNAQKVKFSTISRAVGEKGVLTEGDFARAQLAFPNVDQMLPENEPVAKAKFKAMKELFQARFDMHTWASQGPMTRERLANMQTAVDRAEKAQADFDKTLTPDERAQIPKLEAAEKQRRAIVAELRSRGITVPEGSDQSPVPGEAQ